MSERTVEQTVAFLSAENKRINDAHKSHAEALAWVEKNVDAEVRCEGCSGTGLEEMDQGRYQHCQTCKGAGKKP